MKTIFQLNPEKTTMSLLGKIAEAVIVRRCREDDASNKKWLSIARRKKAKSKTAERFQAVGTGLMRTKTDYPSIYNPADTQRDIVILTISYQYRQRSMFYGHQVHSSCF